MTTAFMLLDAGTEAGSKVNEDAYGLWPREAPRAVWVLDGVTGINDRLLLPGESDAAWFVEQVQEALPALLSAAPDRPAKDLVVALVHELEKRQSAAWLDERGADGRETPAASFALVRLLGDHIEIIRLGDCLVLLESRDGTVRVMDHPVLEQMEADTRQTILDLRAAGMTDPKAILQHMMPKLRAGRSQRNRSDGYGVLASEQSCVALMHVDRIPANIVRRILLVSDGYYRLVDHYGVMNDQELLRETDRRGAVALLRQLRGIEAADPLGSEYPRLKLRDDATALLIAVGASEP